MVNKFVLLCVVCQFLCLVSAQHRFDCHDSYCSKEAPPCPKLDCEGGLVLKNATKCGCCHVCVKLLAENEPCMTKDYSSIPSKMCGPRLICEKNKCVPVKTQCMKDLDEFHEILPFGKTKPECDDMGFYKSVVCISDVLCYCVDKDGKRIFGTDVASRKDSMNCNCSREFEEFSSKIKFEKDDFLRCLPNGDYDPLQCTESSCYCMQDFEGEIDVEDNSNIRNLRCYAERHKNDNEYLRSKCWQEKHFLLEQIEEYEKQGKTVLGVDFPQCDLDGSFAPVQCKNTSCFCVNKSGKMIEGTKVMRNTKDSRNMTCRCAREMEMLRTEKDKNENMNIFAKFKCTPNGNYESIQNARDLNITVDSKMGFQIHVHR